MSGFWNVVQLLHLHNLSRWVVAAGADEGPLGAGAGSEGALKGRGLASATRNSPTAKPLQKMKEVEASFDYMDNMTHVYLGCFRGNVLEAPNTQNG